MSKKHTTESFIKKAKKIHGNKYDYSEFVYPKSNKVKAKFTCNLHGSFYQRPNDHIVGYGCLKCGAKRKSTYSWEDFIKEAKNIHEDKYSYIKSEVNYKKDKVDIICPVHGKFTQKISHHIGRKQGCRKCSFNERNMSNYVSWKKNDWVKKWNGKKVILYFIFCFNNDEFFIKFGITGRCVDERFKSKSKMPYSWYLLQEIEGEAEHIYNLEKQVKKIIKKIRYIPKNKICGSTECFLDNSSLNGEKVIYSEIDSINFINNIIHMAKERVNKKSPTISSRAF